MDNNYNCEIQYRKKIMDKIFSGHKITKDERNWLLTHSVYNEKLGYPYLNKDVLKLKPKVFYNVCIELEDCLYLDRILPIFSVPAGKGRILPNCSTKDYNGNIQNKAIKMFGVELCAIKPISMFEYYSEQGLLSVEYECDYYDPLQGYYVRQSSQTGAYSMIKQELNENKFRYFCKIPNNHLENAMIFTIEFKESE